MEQSAGKRRVTTEEERSGGAKKTDAEGRRAAGPGKPGAGGTQAAGPGKPGAGGTQAAGMKNPGAEQRRPGLPPCVSGKIVRYVMLVMLLALVFLVSAYGGMKYGRGRADRGAGGQTGAGDAGAGNGGTQNGSDQTGIGSEQNGDGREGTGDTRDGNSDGQTGTGDGREDAGGQDLDSVKGTIVLDAGHGGFDPGVCGASGISERELNLIFAKKLGALLEKDGYRVVQTRPTEAGLYDEDQAHKKAQDMQRRCAVIEAAQPLLTVSIHQNSYPDGSVNGPQVFYYSQSKEGERLASCIQTCMNEQLAPESPKTHKGNDSYYILKRSAGTAVIVECGFLTNAAEEVKLLDEDYQDRAAGAIRDGILTYLEGQDAGQTGSETETPGI